MSDQKKTLALTKSRRPF